VEFRSLQGGHPSSLAGHDLHPCVALSLLRHP
jgi:hypothetical protein